jgi:hypothetical protein
VTSGDDGGAGVVLIAAATKIADADAAGELRDSATSDRIGDELAGFEEAVLRLQVGVHQTETGVEEVESTGHVEGDFCEVTVREGTVLLEVI